MIQILEFLPIVMTKDKNWKPKPATRHGSIIYLPKDAILVKPPKKEVKDAK